MKETIERVMIRVHFIGNSNSSVIFQWVGPVDDLNEEFDKIDVNGGGQILFSEFVDWALERNLDIEDDVDEDVP